VDRRTRSVVALVPVLGALAILTASCGGSYVAAAAPRAPQASQTAHVAGCPAAWRASWKRLAHRIDASVYCPSWMPQPLDGEIGSEFAPSAYIDADRSYLVSFIWLEPIGNEPYEVHVNLRGYPGRTTIPMCEDTLTAGGKTVHPRIPCFADPNGTRMFGKDRVTVYTSNQGVDTWHVLYAWRHAGSLYTVSEHIAPPFTYDKVVHNLDRMLRGLVLVRP
jgi:hypothetical protein